MSAGRRSLLPLVAGIAGFIVFLSALGAVGYFFLRGGGSDDRRYWPDHAAMVMAVDVEQLRASEGYRELVAAQPNFAALFEKETKFSPESIRSLTMAGNPAGTQAVIVIHGTRPFTAEDAVKVAGGSNVETVGKYTVHVGTPLSACKVEETVLVIGPAADLRAALSRNGPAVLSSTMEGLLSQADLGKSVSMVVDTSPLGATMERELAMTPAAGAAKDLRAFILEADISKQVELRVTAVWTDATKAEDMRKMLEGLIVMGKQQLTQPGLPADAQKFVGVLDAVKLSTSGPNLLMTLSVEAGAFKGALP